MVQSGNLTQAQWPDMNACHRFCSIKKSLQISEMSMRK